MGRQRHPLEGKHGAVLARSGERWFAMLDSGARVPVDARGEDAPVEGRARVRVKTIEGSPVAVPLRRSWRQRQRNEPSPEPEPEPEPLSVPGPEAEPEPESRLDVAVTPIMPPEQVEDRPRYVATPGTVVGVEDRVAIFVDAANLDRACRGLGIRIQYDELRQFLVGPGRFVAGYYYLVTHQPGAVRTLRFTDFLSHQGFTPRVKKPKECQRLRPTAEIRVFEGLQSCSSVWVQGNSSDFPAEIPTAALLPKARG